MTRSTFVGFAFALLLGGFASTARAANPIQIALFDPVQIIPREEAVHGVRLNLLYGSNSEMKGLDLGLVNRVTGNFLGVQWGVVGLVEGDFIG